MPLARESRSEDASGARSAARFTLIVFALGALYFVVLYLIAH